MRKKSLFGKKLIRPKAIFIVLFIFAIEIVGYFAINTIQQNKIDELTIQHNNLEYMIDVALQDQETIDYFSLEEIIQTLPFEYSDFEISQELDFIRDLSGLGNASDYGLIFQEDVSAPFDYDFPSTFRSVSVQVSMNVEDASDILAYTENILNQERFFFISDVNIVYYTDGSAALEMTLYTFYNDVVL